jgi:hypothetical protein
MGSRSYFFVRRFVIARNYGSALMSQHRLSITQIVFSSAVRPVVSATDLLPRSDLV